MPSPAVPTLIPITTDIWSLEHPFFMPGGFDFRGRMTVVRLATGGLLLHSPVPIDDGVAEQLQDIGGVQEIVAPSLLHHLHLGPVQARYPQARCWGPPGLTAKRSDLRIDATLGTDPANWHQTLEPIFIDGMPWMTEHVFFHRPSGTLICTDLFFNIHEVANWQSRLFFGMYGVLGRPRQSPIVRFLAKDKTAAGVSAQRVVALPVKRLIPAHGRVIDNDAAAVLQDVLAKQLSWAPAALLLA